MKMAPKLVFNPGMLQYFNTVCVYVLAMTLEQNLGRHHTLFSAILIFRETKVNIPTAQGLQNTPKSHPMWMFRRLRAQGLPLDVQKMSLGTVPVIVLASFISRLNLKHTGSTSRL